MNYAKISMLYRLGKITAAEVWSYVPDAITAVQAEKICGPRPEGA